jgi:serine/threonine-protein phosphatase Stp1
MSMTEPMSSFRSAAATHTGMVRKVNEDSYISRDDIGLWSVADGMGGHQAGDVASQMVTNCLDSVPFSPNIGELLQAARAALHSANSKLISMDGQFESGRVPGSTVVVLLIHGNEAAVVWAGDSRIYRLRHGQAEQITRDHSHVQELVDQHLISPEEAESHPMANVITRAIGIEEPLELDVLHLDFMEGDQFLLCSDGLSRLLSMAEIQNLMQTISLEESVKTMVHTALVRGAPDNVTVISVQSDDDRTVVF